MSKRRFWIFSLGLTLLFSACVPAVPLATSGPTETATETPTDIPTETPTVDPASQEPPAATLTIDGETQTALIGTYCWNYEGGGMCADKMGIPSPKQPLPAGQPLKGTLEIPVDDTLNNVTMGIFPADESLLMDIGEYDGLFWTFPEVVGKEQQVVELPLESRQDFEVNLDPGRYVINFFVSWVNQGDATYGFLVEVK